MKVKDARKLLVLIKDNPRLIDPQGDEDLRDLGMLVTLERSLSELPKDADVDADTFQDLKTLRVHIEDAVLVHTTMFLDSSPLRRESGTGKTEIELALELLELWVMFREQF